MNAGYGWIVGGIVGLAVVTVVGWAIRYRRWRRAGANRGKRMEAGLDELAADLEASPRRPPTPVSAGVVRHASAWEPPGPTMSRVWASSEVSARHRHPWIVANLHLSVTALLVGLVVRIRQLLAMPEPRGDPLHPLMSPSLPLPHFSAGAWGFLAAAEACLWLFLYRKGGNAARFAAAAAGLELAGVWVVQAGRSSIGVPHSALMLYLLPYVALSHGLYAIAGGPSE